MKDPVKVLVVAINGYGHYYLKTLLEETDCEKAVLVGVVDPEAEKSKYFQAFKEFGIPVCGRMNDFYLAGGKADLAVISSPPHYHVPQSILALHHGTNVLCEKPVCAQLNEVELLIEKRNKSGKFVLIGYQWSYSEGIQSLKRDILDGRFGKPLRMKSLCMWPRDFAYFARNSWAYKKNDPDGNVVLDSLFHNAMSHFIHNMFFVMGKSMNSSADIARVEARVFRAYPVETFDTGVVNVITDTGVELMFFGSHTAETKVDPCFRIEFEKGFVELKPGADKIIAKTLDKHEFSYPSPESDHQFRKLFVAIDNVINPTNLICTPEAAIPEIKVINEVNLNCLSAPFFPENSLTRTESRIFVRGLDELLLSCYKDFRMIPEKPF